MATPYRPLGGASPNYQILLPILIIAAVIILSVTIGVAASQPPQAQPEVVTTTLEPTATTTVEPTTTPAPPPPTIPVCGGVVQEPVGYENSVVLPQSAIFSWNMTGPMMTQTFLNDVLIATDPIVSAVLYGDRYLVTQLDSSRLTSLTLAGDIIQDIFVFAFPNVYGLVMDGGRLYALSSTNDLLRLQVGATFAVIETSTPMPEPSRYISIDPDTMQPYVLLQNGTIATLNLADAAIQSVCTPAETGYQNIGFNMAEELVGTLPFAIDTITLA